MITTKLRRSWQRLTTGQASQQPKLSLWQRLLYWLASLLIVLSSLWFACALWVQLALIAWLKWLLIALWALFCTALLSVFLRQKQPTLRHRLLIGYIAIAGVGLVWWHNIKPSHERDWAADVAQILDYQQQQNLVRLQHVRNFDWLSETEFTPHWENRQYDLSQLSSVDMITSHWMGPQIAHILVSFGFEDGRYVSFSIETRKEKHEEFSLIGGFFRMYELSLVAADEKDILYTRSNIRGESLYLYRINITKPQMRQLFQSYLAEATRLKQQPRFYNTVTSNCTTIAFNIAQVVAPNLPVDYRLLLSGYLPHYLYEQQALDSRYSFAELQRMAHINPRVAHFAQQTDQSSAAYSRAIRAGVPRLNTTPQNNTQSQ